MLDFDALTPTVTFRLQEREHRLDLGRCQSTISEAASQAAHLDTEAARSRSITTYISDWFQEQTGIQLTDSQVFMFVEYITHEWETFKKKFVPTPTAPSSSAQPSVSSPTPSSSPSPRKSPDSPPLESFASAPSNPN